MGGDLRAWGLRESRVVAGNVLDGGLPCSRWCARADRWRHARQRWLDGVGTSLTELLVDGSCRNVRQPVQLDIDSMNVDQPLRRGRDRLHACWLANGHPRGAPRDLTFATVHQRNELGWQPRLRPWHVSPWSARPVSARPSAVSVVVTRHSSVPSHRLRACWTS